MTLYIILAIICFIIFILSIIDSGGNFGDFIGAIAVAAFFPSLIVTAISIPVMIWGEPVITHIKINYEFVDANSIGIYDNNYILKNKDGSIVRLTTERYSVSTSDSESSPLTIETRTAHPKRWWHFEFPEYKNDLVLPTNTSIRIAKIEEIIKIEE